MSTTSPMTRAELIRYLMDKLARKIDVRFTAYTLWDRETRKDKVVGLEKAGSRGSWRSGFIRIEEGLIDKEDWPSTPGAYSKNLSYIGPKRILEILGEELTHADVHNLRKEHEDQQLANRVRTISRTVRDKVLGTKGNSYPIVKNLERLVELGALDQGDLDSFRDAWAAIDNKLPQEEATS